MRLISPWACCQSSPCSSTKRCSYPGLAREPPPVAPPALRWESVLRVFPPVEGAWHGPSTKAGCWQNHWSGGLPVSSVGPRAGSRPTFSALKATSGRWNRAGGAPTCWIRSKSADSTPPLWCCTMVRADGAACQGLPLRRPPGTLPPGWTLGPSPGVFPGSTRDRAFSLARQVTRNAAPPASRGCHWDVLGLSTPNYCFTLKICSQHCFSMAPPFQIIPRDQV